MQKIQLHKEKKQEVVQSIKQFFLTERSEQLSDFQASIFLDYILNNIGPHIYNQALTDAYALMSAKLEDIYGLEKR